MHQQLVSVMSRVVSVPGFNKLDECCTNRDFVRIIGTTLYCNDDMGLFVVVGFTITDLTI